MSHYNLRKRDNKAEKSRKTPAKTVSHLNTSTSTSTCVMQSVADQTVQGVEGATSDFENGASGGDAIPDTSKSAMDDYFRETTASFKAMIRSTMDSLLENVNRVETELGRMIEFESKRIDELEKKNKSLDTQLSNTKKEVNELRGRIAILEANMNKGERFSRRNNFRIVGIKENQNPGVQEDCVTIVEKILRDKFGMEVKVERAHRDGAKHDNRPRHILVKTLSYRDKTQVMKTAREKLQNAGFFIVDDLTKNDLVEKRKWAEKVKALYNEGTKLRFYAGKWRGNAGEPYKFE